MMVKKGIIGKKLGMTQLFEKEGAIIPITVIEAGPCTITRLRKNETDGYNALQLGFGEGKQATKPELGQLKNIKRKKPFWVIKEIRLEEKVDNYKIGELIKADIFKEGEMLNITGTSIGKGFAGRIKRHHFNRGPMTHGSKCHRLPGSIGAGTSPGHVLKGLRMAGHMGHETVTAKNLEVVKVDSVRNLIMVRGSVPGPDNGIVVLAWNGFLKKVIQRSKKDDGKKNDKKGSDKK